MQDDPGATGANRVSETDAAPMDIEFIEWDFTHCGLKIQVIIAIIIILECGNHGQYLSGKGFVYFPLIDSAGFKFIRFE